MKKKYGFGKPDLDRKGNGESSRVPVKGKAGLFAPSMSETPSAFLARRACMLKHYELYWY